MTTNLALHLKSRPFCKTIGGKQRLIPQLLMAMAPIGGAWVNYHEPFVGGGALFWELVRQGMFETDRKAYLNDADKILMYTYRAVRDDPTEVLRRLACMKNEKEFFLKTRAKMPDLDTTPDTEIAAWRIYLSKVAFNGLWRVNARGQFNAPFAYYGKKRHAADKTREPTIADKVTILACADAMRVADVKLSTNDFEKAIARAKRGDFAYIDSPYYPISKTSSFVSYTAGKFGHEDHVRLRDALREAKARGVSILASNSDCEATRELYSGMAFKIHAIQSSKRSVAASAEKRGPVGELLIT